MMLRKPLKNRRSRCQIFANANIFYHGRSNLPFTFAVHDRSRISKTGKNHNKIKPFIANDSVNANSNGRGGFYPLPLSVRSYLFLGCERLNASSPIEDRMMDLRKARVRQPKTSMLPAVFSFEALKAECLSATTPCIVCI
jgi:hypothetical protein